MSSVNQGILRELKLNNEVPENVMQLLENKFKGIDSLFSGLSTAYQQRRYFKEEFHKIVSLLRPPFVGNMFLVTRPHAV